MDPSTDVLVVGAGPTGVMLGLLLSGLGVSSVVVDKRTEVSQLPRARGINARGAEVLRMVGAEEDVLAHSLRVAPRMEVRRDLSVPPLAVQHTGGETFSVVSPCEGIAISQDVLETVLRRHLRDRPEVDLRVGTRLVDLRIEDDGCTGVVQEADGQDSEISARFVVGADGWRSDVRRLIGVELSGENHLGDMRAVRFAADLDAWLEPPSPALVRLAPVRGVLLATHPDHRWMLMAPVQNASVPVSADRFVRQALGVDAEVTVLGETIWTAAVQQANRFSVGPVLLAGDAAHRVTPVGGSGITSGMADAANLAWKLAGTVQGWGGPRLLESYRAEREPIASSMAKVNLMMWRESQAGTITPIQLRWLEFGYRYASPIILSPPPRPAEIDLTQSFVPRAEPGDRAPHALLEDGRSTIDLAGRSFTLLCVGPGSAWMDALTEVEPSLPVPLTAVADEGEEVRTVFGLDLGEAALIRPDGHIAWRSDRRRDAASAATQLGEALRVATGW